MTPLPSFDKTFGSSREAPLVFTGGCFPVTDSSESSSSGEAKRYVSMRAEKRLRAPDGGLDSNSVKNDSEQDKRFLEKKSHRLKHHLQLTQAFSETRRHDAFPTHISGEPVLQLLSLRVTPPRLSLLVTRSSLGTLCSLRVTV